MYKRDEFIDTKTYGIVVVIAPITYKQNKHWKYDKLAGKTLYWLQDTDSKDIFLWDDELTNELTDEENLGSSVPLDTNLIEE